ncbi:SulP family inorganic anion transporter [Brucella sp. IR073]|uniref:SulP family inorganic anion transporter n=1 Tax=unclassified Brucella TaxID=2632610 RepID=UPI003B97D09A
MLSLSNYRREWFSNIRGDVLSGIVVALALIPEAMGFSVIAGRSEGRVYASFAYACVAAFTGGQPAVLLGGHAGDCRHRRRDA